MQAYQHGSPFGEEKFADKFSDLFEPAQEALDNGADEVRFRKLRGEGFTRARKRKAKDRKKAKLAKRSRRRNGNG